VSQGQYVAAAYGVVFVFVLVYVAIIASKLVRLQRQTAELAALASTRSGREATGVPAREPTRRSEAYAADVGGALRKPGRP
jgi:CcmD family protein